MNAHTISSLIPSRLLTLFLCLSAVIVVYAQKDNKKIQIVEQVLASIQQTDSKLSEINKDITNKELNEADFAQIVLTTGQLLRQYGQTTKAIEMFSLLTKYYESLVSTKKS